MGGTAFFDQLQCLVKFGLRIVGQRQHDVAADILKPGAPGGGKGCPRLLSAVGTAKGAQLGVPGRLHSEGDAVYPRRPEAPQALLGDGLRVCFQGDLRTGHGVCRPDEPFCLRRGEQAGRAAAEIEGVRPQGRVRRKAVQLPQQRVHIGVRYAPLSGAGIKIAVPAFGKTVGNMQIKSKGHTISQPFS